MKKQKLLVKLRTILALRNKAHQKNVIDPEILGEFLEAIVSAGHAFDRSCVKLQFCFMDTEQLFFHSMPHVFNPTPSGGLELKDLNPLTVALTNFFGRHKQKSSEDFWHVEKILSCVDHDTVLHPPSDRIIELFLN